MEHWAKMGKSHLQYICAKSWFPTMRFVFCKKKTRSNFGLIEPRDRLSDMSGKQPFLKIKKNYTAASILVFIFGIKLQFSDQLIMVFSERRLLETDSMVVGNSEFAQDIISETLLVEVGFYVDDSV